MKFKNSESEYTVYYVIEALWSICSNKYAIDRDTHTIFDIDTKEIIPQKAGKVLLKTNSGVSHEYSVKRIAERMIPKRTCSYSLTV